MNLSSKEFDLGFLGSRFEDMAFQLFVSSDVDCYISCITCACNQASSIVNNWSAIQNFISVYYQPQGELAIWNIYLAFFCVETLPLWEKYVIENDKYAVRKLVLDGMQALPDADQALSLLNAQLLGADLEIKDSGAEPNKNFSTPLSAYVRGIPLDAAVESRDLREKKINEIIQFLSRNEDKKG